MIDFFFLKIILYDKYRYSHFIGGNILSLPLFINLFFKRGRDVGVWKGRERERECQAGSTPTTEPDMGVHLTTLIS